MQNIESSDKITKKSTKSIEKGKRKDPLPTLREQERISSKICAYRGDYKAAILGAFKLKPQSSFLKVFFKL